MASYRIEFKRSAERDLRRISPPIIPSLLKALTESAGEFAFDDGWEVELKGLAGRQRVYRVEWTADG